MRVLGRPRLEQFWKRHADAKQPALAMLAELKEADWRTPHDVKRRYATASMVGDRRMVLNLKGNRYRVDIKIDYDLQEILIVRVGTHADYDKWTF